MPFKINNLELNIALSLRDVRENLWDVFTRALPWPNIGLPLRGEKLPHCCPVILIENSPFNIPKSITCRLFNWLIHQRKCAQNMREVVFVQAV